jgi:hypothetical protein
MENLSSNEPSIFNDSQKVNLPNATAVLVLGIISIVGCFCYGLVGFVCGIISLVLASKDMKRYALEPQAFTPSSYNNVKAGRICSIIGLILSSVYLVLIIIVIAAIGIAGLSHPEEFLRQLQH